MSVGSAEQLISNITKDDSTPYTLRTAGGAVEIGDREDLVYMGGGSINWNQHFHELSESTYWVNLKSSIIRDGRKITLTANSSTTDNMEIYDRNDSNRINNHKYLVNFEYKASIVLNKIRLRGMIIIDTDTSLKPVGVWNTYSKIFNYTRDNKGLDIYFDGSTTIPEGSTIEIRDAQLFDLTDMFGPTIANALYNGTQSPLPEGAIENPIAWFRKYFPKPYYAYHANSLESVKPYSHVMTGLNQFNPATGTARVLGLTQTSNARYQITGTYSSLAFADLSGNPITVTVDADGYFSTDNECVLTVTGGNDTDTCVHLVWDGEMDGEWAKYVANTYGFDTSLELRGIPKLIDVAGTQDKALGFDGDEYYSDGTVKRKCVKSVFDGSQVSINGSSVSITGASVSTNEYGKYVFTAYISGFSPAFKLQTESQGMSSYLAVANPNGNVSNVVYVYNSSNVQYIALNIDSNLTTVAQYQTYLAGHPITMIGTLFSPTTESATPYTNPQIVSNWGTEEFVDGGVVAGTRDFSMPTGHFTKYMINLKAKVEVAPDAPSEDGLYVVKHDETGNSYVPANEAIDPKLVPINRELEDLDAKHYTTQDITYPDTYYGKDTVPVVDKETVEVKTLYGQTRAWNQLCGLADGSFSTGNYSSGELIEFNVDHLYLLAVKAIFPSIPSNEGGSSNPGAPVIIGFWNSNGTKFKRRVFSYSSSGYYITYLRGSELAGTLPTGTGYKYTAQLFPNTGEQVACSGFVCRDISMIFGIGNEPAAIADALNALPDLLKKDSFNRGSLVDTTVTGVEAIGVNLLDKSVYEDSTWYSVDGSKVTGLGRTFTISNIHPTTAYLFKEFANTIYYTVTEWDINGGFITGVEKADSTPSWSITTNARTAAIKISLYSNTSADVMLVKGATAPSEFVPYQRTTLMLPQSVTLKSAGSVREELNVVTGDKDILFGSKALSELTWTESSGVYSATIFDMKSNGAVVCDRYLVTVSGTTVSITASATPTGNLIYELAQPGSENIGSVTDPNILVQANGSIRTIQTQTPTLDNLLTIEASYEIPYVKGEDIVDNLESTATNKVLSANQGRVLNNKTEANAEQISNIISGITPVGNAEQLLSSSLIHDQAIYPDRTAGGGEDIGNKSYQKKIVGGTINHNSVLHNGDFASSSGWYSGGTLSIANNIATVTTTLDSVNAFQKVYCYNDVSSVQLVSGHVYAGLFQIKITPVNEVSEAIAEVYVAKSNTSGNTSSGHSVLTGIWQNVNVTFKPSADIRYILFGIGSSSLSAVGIGTTVEVKNCCLIDLTAMFRATIADYVMSIQNPKARVAWLRSYGFLTKPYYPYTAPTLQSVCVSSKENTGFNQFDYDTGKARILANTEYKIEGAYTALAFADLNGNALSITPDSDGLFTSTVEAVLTVTGGDDSSTCVFIHWDDSRDGDYEPFKKYTYPMDSSVTLRGILKLDANNELYYDGDEDYSDGTVNQKYGIVDFKDLNWTVNTSGSYPVFSASIATMAIASGGETNVICNKYLPLGASSLTYFKGENMDKMICRQKDYHNIMLQDSSINPATDLVNNKIAKLNGVILVYPLATPTIESATPFTEEQVCDNWGTEAFTDGLTRDVFVPPMAVADYTQNLRDKLEASPATPDADGLYLMKRENGQNTYVAYTSPIPSAGSEDGTYVLKATVSSGTTTLSWVAESAQGE